MKSINKKAQDQKTLRFFYKWLPRLVDFRSSDRIIQILPKELPVIVA